MPGRKTSFHARLAPHSWKTIYLLLPQASIVLVRISFCPKTLMPPGRQLVHLDENLQNSDLSLPLFSLPT